VTLGPVRGVTEVVGTVVVSGGARTTPFRGGPSQLRRSYCGEAVADVGGPPGDILALVTWGTDREMREVFGLVRAKLEEIVADVTAVRRLDGDAP
jgi:hypothetical protein